MLNLQKYRDLEDKVALALGYSLNAGVWRTPSNLYAMRPPQWTNDDAQIFDLMHQYKLWPFENKENGNYLVEYSTGGDLPGYHLEYVENHHSNKIALRCAILNALLKSIAAKKGN